MSYSIKVEYCMVGAGDRDIQFHGVHGSKDILIVFIVTTNQPDLHSFASDDDILLRIHIISFRDSNEKRNMNRR